MASRYFKNVQAAETGRVYTHLKVNIGATGAPTIADGPFIESIVRNGAGDYTITLQDSYNELFHFGCTQLLATNQDITFQLRTADVSTKAIRFICKVATTATDPGSGSVLYIDLGLKNSSVAV